MIPRFALVRAESLTDARAAYDAAGGDAAFVAGGTELLQVMKMGLASFGTLIDIKRIPDLAGIEVARDGRLRIGAGTTHRAVERSSVVARALPGLVELERGVANVRVRNQGTIGGNLAFAEPHSDPATFLLACGATVELDGAQGRREVPIDEFVVGPLMTSREPDELLVSIHVPPAGAGEGRAYAKLAFFERPAVSVAVRLRVADGRVADAAVAVGSMVESPALVPGAAEPFIGVAAEDAALEPAIAAARDVFATLDAVPDLNGSADYKIHLAGVLLGRAARSALREATAHA